MLLGVNPERSSRSRAPTHIILQPRILQSQALPPLAPVSPWRAGRLLRPARSLAVRMVVALSRRRRRHDRRGGPMAGRSAGRWSASRVWSALGSLGWFSGSVGGGGGAVWRQRGARGGRHSDRLGGWSSIVALRIDARLRWAPVLFSFFAGGLFFETQSCPRLVGQADDELPAYRIPGPPPRHELSFFRPVFRPPRLSFSMQVNKQAKRQDKKKRDNPFSFLCAARFCGGIVAF